jgi:hypothetical protein
LNRRIARAPLRERVAGVRRATLVRSILPPPASAASYSSPRIREDSRNWRDFMVDIIRATDRLIGSMPIPRGRIP